MSVLNGPAVERFDAWADGQLERLRGHPVADRVLVSATHLGDFSLIWLLAAAIRGLTSDEHARQALVFAALLGLESLTVNQGVKRLFRRIRPTETGDPRFQVRRPSTSSFPSGHSSSAIFAATVLIGWDGWVWAPLWLTLAAIVGVSRAYVRIHHPSDVLAGAVVGLGLGLIANACLAAIG